MAVRLRRGRPTLLCRFDCDSCVLRMCMCVTPSALFGIRSSFFVCRSTDSALSASLVHVPSSGCICIGFCFSGPLAFLMSPSSARFIICRKFEERDFERSAPSDLRPQRSATGPRGGDNRDKDVYGSGCQYTRETKKKHMNKSQASKRT